VRGTSDGIVICKSYTRIEDRSFNGGIMILTPTQYLLLSKRSQPKLVILEFSMDVTGPHKFASLKKYFVLETRNKKW